MFVKVRGGVFLYLWVWGRRRDFCVVQSPSKQVLSWMMPLFFKKIKVFLKYIHYLFIFLVKNNNK